MRKVTAIAPANIAFIKYWGRKDEKLRLPANNSLAMNLSNVFTITTVEFLENLKQDQIKMAGEKLDDKSKKRIVDHLERIRNLANIKVDELADVLSDLLVEVIAEYHKFKR